MRYPLEPLSCLALVNTSGVREPKAVTLTTGYKNTIGSTPYLYMTCLVNNNPLTSQGSGGILPMYPYFKGQEKSVSRKETKPMATTTKKSAIVTPEVPRIQDVPVFKPDIPSPDGNAVTPFVFKHPSKKDLTKDGTIMIPLSSLVSLDETSIPDAERAMREIDENNVYSLFCAYEAGKSVPPVLIQQSSEGNILVGGYHRMAAMNRLVTENNGNPDMFIEATPGHFTSIRELLNAAYIDNFGNGLGAAKTSRSRYALQLMAWDAEDGYPGEKPLSIRAAAKLAGVTHVAVMEMRDKLAGKPKTKKMVDTLLSPEDQVEMDAYHAAETAATEEAVVDPSIAMNKATKQMFTSLAQVFALNPNVNELATLFRNFIGKDDEKAVTAISLAMQAVTMNRTFGQKPGITK